MSLSRSGPVGRGGGIGGLLLHAVLAVDASTGALLGPVDVTVRNRTGPRPRTPVHCCPGSPRHRVPQPSRRSAPPRSTPSRRRSRPRCTENARTGLAGPDGLPPADGCTILAARPAQLAAEPPFCRRRSPNCPSPTASQTHVIEGLPRINRLHGISPLPWKQSRCVHTTWAAGRAASHA